ncbi:MAG: helix-turn-helix domain-containing protein [Blastocatellia bacterium]
MAAINQNHDQAPIPPANETDIYDDGQLHIEYSGYYVSSAGQPLYDLTRNEFLLLARLARCSGRVVTHESLWNAVWSENEPVKRHLLRVHMVSLRRKLAPHGIEVAAVFRCGYRLISPGRQTSPAGDPVEQTAG